MMPIKVLVATSIGFLTPEVRVWASSKMEFILSMLFLTPSIIINIATPKMMKIIDQIITRIIRAVSIGVIAIVS